jgi:hypothetical protein
MLGVRPAPRAGRASCAQRPPGVPAAAAAPRLGRSVARRGRRCLHRRAPAPTWAFDQWSNLTSGLIHDRRSPVAPRLCPRLRRHEGRARLQGGAGLAQCRPHRARTRAAGRGARQRERRALIAGQQHGGAAAATRRACGKGEWSKSGQTDGERERGWNNRGKDRERERERENGRGRRSDGETETERERGREGEGERQRERKWKGGRARARARG